MKFITWSGSPLSSLMLGHCCPATTASERNAKQAQSCLFQRRVCLPFLEYDPVIRTEPLTEARWSTDPRAPRLKDTTRHHRLPVDQREGELRLQEHGGDLDHVLSEPQSGHVWGKETGEGGSITFTLVRKNKHHTHTAQGQARKEIVKILRTF